MGSPHTLLDASSIDALHEFVSGELLVDRYDGLKSRGEISVKGTYESSCSKSVDLQRLKRHIRLRTGTSRPPHPSSYPHNNSHEVDHHEDKDTVINLNMAPHPGIDTGQIKEKARRDLLHLLEGVCQKSANPTP